MTVEPVVLRPDRPIPAWQLRAWELVAPRLPRRVIGLIGRIMMRLRGSRARRWYLLNVGAIA